MPLPSLTGSSYRTVPMFLSDETNGERNRVQAVDLYKNGLTPSLRPTT